MGEVGEGGVEKDKQSVYSHNNIGGHYDLTL